MAIWKWFYELVDFLWLLSMGMQMLCKTCNPTNQHAEQADCDSRSL